MGDFLYYCVENFFFTNVCQKEVGFNRFFGCSFLREGFTVFSVNVNYNERFCVGFFLTWNFHSFVTGVAGGVRCCLFTTVYACYFVL